MESFSHELNAYCVQLGRSSKDIAESCGLSASALSRYRRGGRTPFLGGDSVAKLAAGLGKLFAESGMDDYPTEAEIAERLSACLQVPADLAAQFCKRLDQLMTELSVRNAEMARHMGIDPSYLSRIRNSQRVPGNTSKFANSASKLLAKRAIALDVCEKICGIIELDEVHSDTRRLSKAISTWLVGNTPAAKRA